MRKKLRSYKKKLRTKFQTIKFSRKNSTLLNTSLLKPDAWTVLCICIFQIVQSLHHFHSNNRQNLSSLPLSNPFNYLQHTPHVHISGSISQIPAYSSTFRPEHLQNLPNREQTYIFLAKNRPTFKTTIHVKRLHLPTL